jgi:ribosome-binding protein aMBF1 (putative translation factor)
MKKKNRIHESQLRRTTRQLTPAQLAKVERVRKSAVRDRAKILATLDELVERHERRAVILQDALSLLREARQDQGISLPELSARTGIGKGALSRLETGADRNPTIRTLARVATALNKKLMVGLVDD